MSSNLVNTSVDSDHLSQNTDGPGETPTDGIHVAEVHDNSHIEATRTLTLTEGHKAHHSIEELATYV